ncbi:MAG: hypothetical protein AAGK78_14310, partial [Planctomycetota bacterium]
MVYAGGIAGVIILSRLNGKTLSVWDPSILALTVGIFLLRVVEGTHENVITRQQQRDAAIAELTACEQGVRSARQTKANNYRGVAPTARGREWDAEERKGLQACRERTPVPAAPNGNGLTDLGVLDWFVLIAPCVIDFALIGLVKRFGAAAIDVALRGDEYNDQPDIHPAFRGVDLAKLPPDIVADLDIMAGTYNGKLLGEPQWRRVDGGRILWPVFHGRTTPNGGTAFIGVQRLTEGTTQKAPTMQKPEPIAPPKTSDHRHRERDWARPISPLTPTGLRTSRRRTGWFASWEGRWPCPAPRDLMRAPLVPAIPPPRPHAH